MQPSPASPGYVPSISPGQHTFRLAGRSFPVEIGEDGGFLNKDTGAVGQIEAGSNDVAVLYQKGETYLFKASGPTVSMMELPASADLFRAGGSSSFSLFESFDRAAAEGGLERSGDEGGSVGDAVLR